MATRGMKALAVGLGATVVLGGGLAVAAAAGADPSGLLDRHPRIERLTDLKGAGDHFLHTETTYLGAGDAPMTVKAISGSVTKVSATSITVTASDGVSDTFSLDAATKITLVDPTATPKRKTGAIADVQAGHSVVVSARGPAGADAPATRILVRP
ncbi:MAG: hypothetical protein JWN61_389 [Pseudonocardiales bacterium]|nr:hypothetical protein [Jatrophihabitantaceae bacterium]MCW2602254.1 hypothetical protein [Pseudonocardiales bacterium]